MMIYNKGNFRGIFFGILLREILGKYIEGNLLRGVENSSF